MRKRSIVHIDMNAFYCSCHEAEDPDKYQGLPTAVAGSPETRHGVIVTASYAARARGVRATMTVAEGLRVCPELVLIHPDFELYRAYSRRVFSIVRSFTPDLEIFSIDECWADVTHSHQFGTPVEIAHQLQSRILQEAGLPCSIGVAPNKFLAKMASDFKKPLGITEIWQEDVAAKIWPLPVGTMFGIGHSTRERLNRLGVETIRDLAHFDPAKLERMFGKRAGILLNHANGVDDSPVNPNPEPLKSIGHSMTLAADTSDLDELYTVLLNLSDQVCRRLRRHTMRARTVQLTIRFANRQTITRMKTMAEPTELTERIYQEACALLTANKPRGVAVRLLGVAVSQLEDMESTGETVTQLQLFPEDRLMDTEDPAFDDKRRKLTAVSDELRDKYGESILVRGRMLQTHESQQIRNRQIRGTSLQKDNL